jgi:thymidylate synthase (FAD)
MNVETFKNGIDVLDKGYVKLIQFMGDDHTVCEAARRSVQTNKKRRPDNDLIDYLIRNGHHSPMESCVMTVEIKAPIFVMRQCMRHRTGAFSELSLRYTVPHTPEFYEPDESRVDNDSAELINATCKLSEASYMKLLEAEVSGELARTVLPVNMYTNVWMTMNLRNWLHFLNERLNVATQQETREYAFVIHEILSALYPVCVASWEDHVFFARTFSLKELNALATIDMEYDTMAKWIDAMPDDRAKRILKDKLSAI